ncbi:CDP-diacylglycerol--glycerol-3-phosphate 3-phosphatidyltransferase [Alteromonas sp. KUL49]|uniref:CDP-diacylglycerol--glycerol-3-phosphate 3-phosphatidyltransferase n=1 Tax=Alteromonas sp. KUL49 TaxID=2480798 RepID=UPI00102F1C6D|nr:CDP-diacylglycerol--glycerol-3-phosphate 3-phosphatidyltransferase [Alteromonas sp. KUL49]TAP40796.1 CDP-diacylglycerol--glycerol-3-phosphate 3-phosphatidyltransferase [Alteromonas sp. KUL49]GEA10972.1 CDP-diacylglycerol--glycerol-3-phosphate 3-phosphatidyltransferase [Alteromonas sp. KUL49]
MWTIPNVITLFRVLLIPVFVVIYFLDWRWAHEVGALIFWLAAITDWFDGYLARKLQQSTPFGAFLDPVADKLIVAAALLMITHSYATLWITIPAVILLIREIYVSALREWMGQRGVREAVKVSFIGKAKTTAQMLALIGLLSGLETFMGVTIYWVTLGYVLLYLAAVLSLWSMIQYSIAAWPHLKGDK